MEDSTGRFKHVQNFEDDELEHGAGKGEVNAENELDKTVSKLIIFEEFFHEKDPADDEKNQLCT